MNKKISFLISFLFTNNLIVIKPFEQNMPQIVTAPRYTHLQNPSLTIKQVRKRIKNGANPFSVNKKGKNALEMAISRTLTGDTKEYKSKHLTLLRIFMKNKEFNKDQLEKAKDHFEYLCLKFFFKNGTTEVFKIRNILKNHKFQK